MNFAASIRERRTVVGIPAGGLYREQVRWGTGILKYGRSSFRGGSQPSSTEIPCVRRVSRDRASFSGAVPSRMSGPSLPTASR